MKKIGILGTGSVGKTLAFGFHKHGYKVMVGSREPSKLDDWIKNNASGVYSGTFKETAEFGDIVVLAVKGTAALDALKLCGKDSLKGKVIIDTTNPIASEPPVNGVLHYTTSLGRSLMEDLQKTYPDSHFVKAFSCVGSSRMVDPDFEEGRPTMFICGNNADAKKAVTEILNQFRWDTEDMGAVEAARAIEPLAMLWCIPGFLHGSWTHALKMLKK